MIGRLRRPSPTFAGAALAAAGALCAAWALASLRWPPGFDHGLYAWIGDVVIRGGMMYRDAWDMHGPLVPYLYAAPQWALGRQFWGVRVLDLAMLGLASVALWRMVARTGPAPSRAAAWWATVLFVLTYASLGYNETAQPDGWVGLASAAAFAPALLARRPSAGHLILAGVAVGLFALVKPFFALLGLVPLVLVALSGLPHGAGDEPRGQRPIVKRTALGALTVGLAAAVPVAVVLGAYAARDALDALLDVHVLYTSRVYNDGFELRLGERLAGLVELLWRGKVVPVAVAAAAVGAIVLWRLRERALLGTLVVWLGLALFFALLQNKFYYYHWIAVLPPLTLLATYGLTAARRSGGDDPGTALATATLVVLAAHAALRPAVYVAQAAAFALGRTSADSYYATFQENALPQSRPLDRARVAEYIGARIPESEGVAVWGIDAGIPYLAERPTRFRLAGWYWAVVSSSGDTAVRSSYVREYVHSLRNRTPAYLVVNRAAGDIAADARLDRTPEVAAEVSARFVSDTVIGPFELFRRRDLAPSGR